MLVFGNSVIADSILVLLGIAGVIQLYYILFQFSGVGFKKISSVRSNKYEPVSVIICARNELKNLREFLPQMLKQDYPQFQVVVDITTAGGNFRNGPLEIIYFGDV